MVNRLPASHRVGCRLPLPGHPAEAGTQSGSSGWGFIALVESLVHAYNRCVTNRFSRVGSRNLVSGCLCGAERSRPSLEKQPSPDDRLMGPGTLSDRHLDDLAYNTFLAHSKWVGSVYQGFSWPQQFIKPVMRSLLGFARRLPFPFCLRFIDQRLEAFL